MITFFLSYRGVTFRGSYHTGADIVSISTVGLILKLTGRPRRPVSPPAAGLFSFLSDFIVGRTGRRLCPVGEAIRPNGPIGPIGPCGLWWDGGSIYIWNKCDINQRYRSGMRHVVGRGVVRVVIGGGCAPR